jgi:2-C-methyl-D-erythritol 4-phosphate cytidylyltransferase / 2-C-methyl-D-erythritol 2,4-cyclodiphosphate synthase
MSKDLAILIAAAGRGHRAGEGIPKQYRNLAGKPLLARTLACFVRALPGGVVLPIVHKNDLEFFQACLAEMGTELAQCLAAPVLGGATRQESVRAGLEALSNGPVAPEIVLIHDAVRPFVGGALIERAIRSAKDYGAAVPGVAVTDTIKEIDPDRSVTKTLPRCQLRAIQTPQAFRFDLILAAHRQAAAGGMGDLTDDAAVAEFAGHRIHVFEGEESNVKITVPDDFASAEAKLHDELTDVRTGQGYDVHAFEPGSHIWLGGVKIEHDRGLAGHSDADVLSHAITDAVLGALADGDIGSHFPPSDPQWRGAPSRIFLAAAAAKLRARGGVIAHIDATIVCERPKLGPYREAIRHSIAEIMDIRIERVAVKSTTSERLGFTGREEGIAALAIATVRLPQMTQPPKG